MHFRMSELISITTIYRLATFSLAILCLVSLGPGSAFAEDIDFGYGVIPNPSANDSSVSNEATMQGQNGTSYSSNTVCTNVGNPQDKCETGSSNQVVQAAQDLYNAIVSCTPSQGVDLLGPVMQAASSCISGQLKGKYSNNAISIAVNGAVGNAQAEYCYQCVGFVEDALVLAGVSPNLEGHGSGSEFWTSPPPGYTQLTSGSPQPGDIVTHDDGNGHVGIVKSVQSYNPTTTAGVVIVLDANADDKGGISAAGGTCDLSDSHIVDYNMSQSGDSRQNRFLRNQNLNATQPSSTPTTTGSSTGQ